MKFGVRECCDVVFRAKAPMKVGNKIFYKNEPVIYFDTLKTSTLEGAATTVYAQGGRGNARLMSWDGERTVTFTMEDALISPEGLAILTGAGLVEASASKPIYVHSTETMAIGTADDEAKAGIVDGKVTFANIPLSEKASLKNAAAYVMLMDPEGNMITEPFASDASTNNGRIVAAAGSDDEVTALKSEAASIEFEALKGITDLTGYMVLVDYYVKKTGNAMEINITPDKFGGAFYIEASTLFREYPSQLDLPAEFIIPNARVQSNFTFTMAGSGDPSTFTFTMDAFPDYTRFNKTEKVLASIQVIGGDGVAELTREASKSTREEQNGLIVDVDGDSVPADSEEVTG